MATLLFEIGTEELPSWYVLAVKKDIASLMAEKLAAVQLKHGEISSYVTPRRVAVLVEDIAEKTPLRQELRRGPAKAVAFDAGGAPSKAALGFARANGVEATDLIVQDADKGSYVFARKELGGEEAAKLLPDLLAELLSELPAPRKMRWADVDTPFVRPVSWLLALLDEQVIDVVAAGQKAGRESHGHRFLATENVNLGHARDYLNSLEKAYVIADVSAREQLTLKVAQETAKQQNLTLVNSGDLLTEVSHLLEYPVAVLGSFERGYLDLPEEVLITTMTHHQRFFPTRSADGKLAPYFVAISNNRVPDDAVLCRGYEQVLSGRLADARFFWDADRSKTLAEHAKGLAGIGFQRQLGTMAQKLARMAKTARTLADLLGLSQAEREVLEQATAVFRADLSTQMVYELPELEGVMARAYALAEGYPAEVAQVLEHGVRPNKPAAPLPAVKVGAVLAVADRLDKLLGFFAIGKKPSGSADPFGLRRDAIALARILNQQGWPLTVSELVEAAAKSYQDSDLSPQSLEAAISELAQFSLDRVAGLLAEEGIRVELLRAAMMDKPAVITASRRCHLLQAMSQEDEFGSLMMLYKRAANLAKEAKADIAVNPELFADEHEESLYAKLPRAKAGIAELMSLAEQNLAPWDLGQSPKQPLSGLEAGIAAVLELKAPLDAFLDHVLVMVEDETVRNNRLALLTEVRDALRALGALEELEGL